ncbi:unnamed protein product [Adineta steineri]|uniref:Uncharacterized protein n=1 Tax=Adineta steineri TaxID=433720 RepID=A0A813V755_9BILA|nr:unnamed protein product [Adineta steineri]CAF3624605.1 unnamed protein product [Adineta steineri]
MASSSSSLNHSFTTASSSNPLSSIQALDGTPFLKPDHSISSSTATIDGIPIETTKNSFPVFDHTDTLRIFQGKKIVFFGDSAIRLLYRDLSKLLHKNKFMSEIELSKQRYDHPLYVNEISIETHGLAGISDRIDCRQNSLTVEWLQQIVEYQSIDILIVSCAYPDLSFRQLETLNKDFDTTLQSFIPQLSIVLSKLNSAFCDHTQYESIKIWISPIPYKINDIKQYQQYTQLLDMCLYITNQLKFNQLRHMDPWINYYKRIYVKDSYNISSEGIRQLTNQIIEIVEEKQIRPLYRDLLQAIRIPIVISETSIPMINSTVPIQVDIEDENRQIMMEKRRAQFEITKREARKRRRANKKQEQKTMKSKLPS